MIPEQICQHKTVCWCNKKDSFPRRLLTKVCCFHY